MGIEIRYHENSKLIDEIVSQNETVHIEQLSDDCFWLGIGSGDNQQVFHFTLAKETITDDNGDAYRPIILEVRD